MTRHGIQGLLIVLALLIGGCQESSGARQVVEGLPAIDRSGLEPPLARAVETSLRAVERGPDSAEVWGELGILCDIHDLSEAATVAYTRAATLAPTVARWPYHLGTVQAVRDPAASLPSLRAARALAPEEPAIARALAEGCILSGELDTARSLAAELERLAPDSAAGPVVAARVALLDGDLPRAREALARGESRDPEAAEVQRLLAELARREGRPEAAAEHERRRAAGTTIALADPFRTGLGLERGVTLRWQRERSRRLLELGRADEALAQWQQAIDADPQAGDYSIALRLELGSAQLRAGRAAQAITTYRALLMERPDDATVEEGLGSAALQMRNIGAAIVHYQRALALDPSLHETRGTLGAVLVGEGKVEEGLTELERAAEALPDSPPAAFNLGLGYRTAGRNDAAIESLRRAIALDPGLLRARFELGVTLGTAKRFDEAADVFSEVVAAAPERRGAHGNLVRALLRSSRWSEALSAARAGLAAFPGDATFRWQEVWILAVAEDPQVTDGAEATRLLSAILAEQPGPPGGALLELRAAVHAANGEFEAAVAALDEALALEPPAELRARHEAQRAAYGNGIIWRD